MWVVKASGKMEKFNVNKVRRTCVRAGASKDVAERISKQVQQRVRNGMSTQEILTMTLSLLRRETPQIAARYDLKGALLRIGPAGFIFEELIAQVLREHGYKTRVHNMIKGGSEVMHEIDVIAIKPTVVPKIVDVPSSKTYAIECKYHNSPGIYTGVKEVLYTFARFLDLQDGYKKGFCEKFDQSWLVTNTKFSRDTLKYGISKNIRMLSWDHPKGESLRDLIEQKKLYPITVLRNLDTNTQGKLAQSNIVLVNTLLNTKIEKLSLKTGISVKKLQELIKEAQNIIQ